MKMKSMKMKPVLSALVVVGLAVASQSALAGTITASYLGSANFGSGSVNYEIGYITPGPGGGTAHVGIGGDSFSVTSSSGAPDFPVGIHFNTWCVDIYHWLTSPFTYTIATGTDLANVLAVVRPGTSPTGVDRVDSLVK